MTNTFNFDPKSIYCAALSLIPFLFLKTDISMLALASTNRVREVVAGDVHCWFAHLLEDQEIPPTNETRQIMINTKTKS